jgi:hypothetical protein
LEYVKFLTYWESLEIGISNIRFRKRNSGEALGDPWELLGTLESLEGPYLGKHILTNGQNEVVQSPSKLIKAPQGRPGRPGPWTP